MGAPPCITDIMNTPHRIEWIDIAKALGIILVSFGHIRNGDGESVWLPALDSTIDAIYLFHMPLFFILGGLTFSAKRPFRQFAVRKIRTLLIPYYFFSLYFLAKPIAILAIPSLASAFQTDHNYDLAHQFYDVLIDGNGLWFLMAFFVAEIMTYGIVKGITSSTSQIALGVILIAGTYFWTGFDMPNPLPFQILKGIQITGFFLVIHALRNSILTISKRTASLAVAPFLVLLVACHLLLLQFERWNATTWLNVLITIVAAFAGGITVIAISIVIRHSTLLSKIGKDSLVYYALNALTLNIVKLLIFRILGIDATSFSFAIQLLTGCIITILSLILLAIENAIIQRGFWWVIGKPNPQLTIDNES